MSALAIRRDARGVVTLTLDRPKLHNAFDDVMIAELIAALAQLAEDGSVRVLVLAAEGRSFCAGADLAWMRRSAEYTRAQNVHDAAMLGRLMQALDAFPRPTVARVQGSVYGGGVGLVACCDFAVAVRGAQFRLSEVRLGLIPALVSPYVVRALGARQARRYFLSAEPFDADQAHAMGLVTQVTEADALDEAVAGIVVAVLQGAPEAQHAAKQLVALCERSPIDAALTAATAELLADRRASAEGRAGLHAFLTKAVPPWRDG